MLTRGEAMPKAHKNILVIDVGGTHIKVLATGQKEPVKIDSGPKMTAKKMVKEVRNATKGSDSIFGKRSGTR